MSFFGGLVIVEGQRHACRPRAFTISEVELTWRSPESSGAGSFHILLLRDAEPNVDEVITKLATEQFQVHHGAEQVIPIHNGAFDHRRVMTEYVIRSRSKQDPFGLPTDVATSTLQR